MSKYVYIALFVLSTSTLFGQTLIHKQKKVALIGATQLLDNIVIISREDQHHVRLSSYDISGRQKWTTPLEISAVYGHNYNKLQLLGDSNSVWLVQQLTDHIVLTSLNKHSGQIEQTQLIKRSAPNKNNEVWHLVDAYPRMYATLDGSLVEYQPDSVRLNGVGLLATSTLFPSDNYTVHFGNKNFVFATNNSLDPSHRSMLVYLEKYNLTTKDTITREIALDLEHTSFTYFNDVEKRIFNVIKGENGFYLLGKLDIAFEKKYPTQKHGDDFIGFWVAKVNDDLTLDYFSEIPFQYLEPLIPADVVRRSCEIDLKEDSDNGIFLTLNELPNLLYHNKYFVHLNKNGDINMATGGKDEYHYLGYDRMGLREAGRKYNLRLLNDDWSPYATNVFLYLSPQKEHRKIIQQIYALDRKNLKLNKAKKAYTFFEYGEQSLIFTHTEKKGGTLRIYVP